MVRVTQNEWYISRRQLKRELKFRCRSDEVLAAFAFMVLTYLTACQCAVLVFVGVRFIYLYNILNMSC